MKIFKKPRLPRKLKKERSKIKQVSSPNEVGYELESGQKQNKHTRKLICMLINDMRKRIEFIIEWNNHQAVIELYDTTLP